MSSRRILLLLLTLVAGSLGAVTVAHAQSDGGDCIADLCDNTGAADESGADQTAAGPQQGDPCEGECPTTKRHLACSTGLTCEAQPVQDLRQTYRYGQAVYVECNDAEAPYPACPKAGDVDITVTVLASVAKVLHSGTTISTGKVSARLGKDVNPNPSEGFSDTSQYYVVELKPSVVKRMKAINVSFLGMTVTGTVTRSDGTKAKIKHGDDPEITSFHGNCSGRNLHIQRRLTYGGHCTSF